MYCALAQQCLFRCTFHPIRWAYLCDLTKKINRGRQGVAPRGTTHPYFGEITRITHKTLFMHFVLLNHHVYIFLKGLYSFNSIYPHPCRDDSNYSYPSLIRRGANVCGHSAIYRKLIAVEWMSDEQKKYELLKHKVDVMSTTCTRVGWISVCHSGPNYARFIRL